jgi:glycosyltransferase involved in cell wall biosynthesis
MNIVLIGTAYPLRGGIAHYIGLLYRYLSREHSVTVVTFSRQYPKFLFPGKTQEETGDPGVPLESRVWIDSINPFNWIRSGFRVRRLNADLIIFKFWMPFFAPCYGVIAAIARWNRRTRTMFICDNVIPHERRPGDKFLTQFAFRFIDAYVVQSRAVERDLALWKRDPLTAYLPHPVYEIFGDEMDRAEARRRLASINPALDLGPDAKVVLFFGYVRDYKGLDVLIDAMPRILERHDVTALVVGEFYNNEQQYRDQVAKLGLEQRVLFHADYVPNEQVAAFFSAADVVTLPYHSATQSGIIQIAYNFHRPVICTDVGGLGEVVIDGTTGFVTPPKQPAAFADAVCRFYDEGLRERFRANVMEEKKKYSWDYMTAGIMELYGKAAGSPSN